MLGAVPGPDVTGECLRTPHTHTPCRPTFVFTFTFNANSRGYVSLLSVYGSLPVRTVYRGGPVDTPAVQSTATTNKYKQTNKATFCIDTSTYFATYCTSYACRSDVGYIAQHFNKQTFDFDGFFLFRTTFTQPCTTLLTTFQSDLFSPSLWLTELPFLST